MVQDDETVLAPASLPEGVPERIGRYRVARLLGRGGMGLVVLAQDLALERQVAIKLVSAGHGISEEMQARFAREARSAAQVNHPHIATVYDVGVHEGEPFIAMEYVAGDSLAERLGHGALSVERTFVVARQLGSALAAAHAAGIVHRDIKPGNVMLSAGGTLKLLDFGLARVGRDSPEQVALTRTGAIVGTPAYMSPEQVRGDSVGPKSDIFSLGVLLYEALTGVSPFARSTVFATIGAIASQDPPPVEAERPDVPDSLAHLVAACLRKEPSARPDAPSFLAALEGQRAPAPSVRPPGAVAGRVALLPFTNVSGTEEHEWVGVGLVDTLGHELRRSEGITLADTSATGALAQEALAPRELGERLGAEWVILGSFQVAGPRLRITCRVLHVPDGEETSCERVDGQLADIFDVQDEVVAAVRAVLETRRRRTPSGGTTGAGQPEDMRAYEAYARGLLEMRSLGTAGAEAAEVHFRRAIELAPDYPAAWMGLGAVLQFHFLSVGAPTLEESVRCLERAIAFDPHYALAHAWISQAYCLLADYPRGLEHGERAVQLDPAHLDCWVFLGLNQMCQTVCLGDGGPGLRRATESWERGRALVPHYASIHHNLGVFELMMGALDAAAESFRTSESLESGGARHERWPGGEAYLGAVDFVRGDLDAAEPRLRAGAPVLEGDDHFAAVPMAVNLELWLAELLFRRGTLDEAAGIYAAVGAKIADAQLPGIVHGQLRAELGSLRVAHARGEDVGAALEGLRERVLAPEVRGAWGYDMFAGYTFFDAAVLHVEVGQHARGLELLGLAVDHGLLCLPRIDSTPALEPLRGDPGLEALRGRIMEATG